MNPVVDRYPRQKVPDLPSRRIGWAARKWIACATHASYLIAHLAPRRIPLIFVTGFPKSGTVWVTQMVADYLQYPFIDLSFFPAGCPAVMHGHYRVKRRSPPMVYVVRDGRDALVSMYFYMAREIPEGDHPRLPPGFARYFKGLKNKNAIREFLPTFIERQFQRPFGCRWNWSDHVASYFQSHRGDVPLVKYESLLADPLASMTVAIGTLTGGEPVDQELLRFAIDKYSFERQTGRRAGEENPDAFVRKGQAGDWRNHFSRAAAEVFDRLAGQTLIDLGYEPNRDWVRELDS